MDTPTIPAGQLRRIAVDADADPRSVRAVLRGRRLRGMVDDRVRRALQDHGITPLPYWVEAE
jgi:hypothetical protein